MSPTGSSVHGVLQAGILEWVAISFSRGSFWPRDRTWICLHCKWILYQLSHQGSPHLAYVHLKEGFPGGPSGEEPVCQCRRHKRSEFNPWVGTIPWRAWQPTPVFLPGESPWTEEPGYSPWDCQVGHDCSDLAHMHAHLKEAKEEFHPHSWKLPSLVSGSSRLRPHCPRRGSSGLEFLAEDLLIQDSTLLKPVLISGHIWTDPDQHILINILTHTLWF